MIFQGWQRPESLAAASESPPAEIDQPKLTALQIASAEQFVLDLSAVKATGHRVILVFDADLSSIYRGRPTATPEWVVIGKLAQRVGLETINLSPIFEHRYRDDQTKFDFSPDDTHWNAYGHNIAADAVAAAIRAPVNASKH